MSYLSKFTATELPFNQGIKYSIKWRSVTGTVRLSNGFVYYKRFSKLGELLFANKESERHFISRAIRTERGVPDTQPLQYVAI